jgi:hypothetical protein
MKTLRWLGMAALLMGAAMPGRAMMEFEDVSPERAKEMGIVVQSHTNGDAGVAVVVEFKAEGALKNFSRADLRVRTDGKSLVSVSLLTVRKEGATVQTRFSVDPTWLAKSELMLVVNNGTRTIIGYRLKAGEFVEIKP